MLITGASGFLGSRAAKYFAKDYEVYTPTHCQMDITEINTSAIDWMSKYERDPLPSKVVWQTDVGASLRKTQAFYWLDRNGDTLPSRQTGIVGKDNNRRADHGRHKANSTRSIL
jgi:hypothetical protein